MKLHSLKPPKGAKHRRKVVGRGDSSGLGHTAGRGHKGQLSRSGAKHRPYFEGGQIPLFRRLPKRGFNHPTKKNYNIVNLSVLDDVCKEGDTVDRAFLLKKGVIRKNKLDLKILADGDISKKITVKADKFSEAAKSQIESVGGSCELNA